jgi:hypothetical protein
MTFAEWVEHYTIAQANLRGARDSAARAQVDVTNAFESASLVRDEIHNALRQIVNVAHDADDLPDPYGALDRIKGIALATIAKLRIAP